MISRIRGTLVRRDMDTIEVLTPGGVGYELEIPRSVYERLPRQGEEVELRTFQVVREDALILFGFADDAERSVFARLLGASGVGPRLALAMLSAHTPQRLARAIAERDVDVLRQIPGIGKKTAERLVLELADKLGDVAMAAAGPRPEGRAAEDAVGALIALGFQPAEATTAVRRALESNPDLSGPGLIKAALAARAG